MITDVIIPFYNKPEMTLKCIECVQLNKNVNIILINHNSNEQTNEVIKKEVLEKYNNIEYIFLNKKYNFSEEINFGLLKASHDYILILCNDVFIENDTIEKLIKWTEKLNGFIGGCGARVNKNPPYSHELVINVPPFDVDYIGMSLMFGKIELFNIVGLMDPNYYIGYYDDCDFGLTAQKLGIKSYVVDNLKYHHIGGATMNDEEDLDKARYVNLQYFEKKWRQYLLNRNKTWEVA